MLERQYPARFARTQSREMAACPWETNSWCGRIDWPSPHVVIGVIGIILILVTASVLA